MTNHPNRNKKIQDVSEEIARKVLTTVDAGLVSGIGVAKPGQMCVEAAVCYAYGLPHSDQPPCVGSAVRLFKIRLNDSCWPTDADRTAGMRKLAIAQLGSNTIDQDVFADIVARETIKRILPLTMRLAAAKNPKFAEEIEAAAKLCQKDGSRDSARQARDLMRKVRAATAIAIAAAAAAATAAYAAAYAATAAYAARLQVLNLCAKIGLDALIELKSPGCDFLYLCEQ